MNTADCTNGHICEPKIRRGSHTKSGRWENPTVPEGLWVFGIWRAEGTSIGGGTLKLHKTTEVNEIKGPESGEHTRLSLSSFSLSVLLSWHRASLWAHTLFSKLSR